MAYGYCFGCGVRVSTSDLTAGLARRLPHGLCCAICVRNGKESLPAGGVADKAPSEGAVQDGEPGSLHAGESAHP
jgi:hypothetical protein